MSSCCLGTPHNFLPRCIGHVNLHLVILDLQVNTPQIISGLTFWESYSQFWLLSRPSSWVDYILFLNVELAPYVLPANRFLTIISQVVASMGLDQSEASISVQISLSRRAIRRPTGTNMLNTKVCINLLVLCHLSRNWIREHDHEICWTCIYVTLF